MNRAITTKITITRNIILTYIKKTHNQKSKHKNAGWQTQDHDTHPWREYVQYKHILNYHDIHNHDDCM